LDERNPAAKPYSLTSESARVRHRLSGQERERLRDHAGGLWVIAPDERFPGTIPTPVIAANCGWREDGKPQHITVETAVYRIKLRMP
jgi:hypothetical protein